MRVRFPILVGCALIACSNYRDQLNRSQRYYDESRFEHSLAVLRVLEEDMDSLTWPERARYAYFRGMTDYRLGYRSHARYWLGICQAIQEMHPDSIAPEWDERAKQTLTDLNKDVYGGAEFADSESTSQERSLEGDAASGAGSSAPAEGGRPAPAGDTPAQRSCRHDQDCTGSEVCLGNQCVVP